MEVGGGRKGEMDGSTAVQGDKKKRDKKRNESQIQKRKKQK